MNRTVSKDLIILHHVERKCGACRWLGAQGSAHGQIHLLLTFPSCCDVRCLNPQVPHLQNFHPMRLLQQINTYARTWGPMSFRTSRILKTSAT